MQMVKSLDTEAFKITPTENVDNNIDISDRLSALPECVLLHILSLLDTKEAAITSCLSTRWRHLFLSLRDIDLCFSVKHDASDSDCARLFHLFIQFVDRVLQQRNKEPIRKIQFRVNYFIEGFRSGFESLLMSTATAISDYKVESLDIFVEMDKTTAELCFVTIPPGIFSSESLVYLLLNLRVGWKVPEFVWLPNLKYFQLISFILMDEDSIHRLLKHCPSLEHLELIVWSLVKSESENENENAEGKQLDALRVSSPSLKRLGLIWDDKVESDFNVIVESENLEDFECSLEGRHKVTLGAPNLKTLVISGQMLEVDITQRLVSIDEAMIEANFPCHLTNMDDFSSRVQQAFKFFSRLQRVKSLSLSENIMKALYASLPLMPTFGNLIKLELIPEYCLSFPRLSILQVLLKLFENSPNLEVLIFNEVFDNYFGEDEEIDHVVPLTFVEHLKEIEISNFKGGEIEFKMVEYFLKNGKSLEKITLDREGWESKPNHYNRILSFKKCSEDCQIVFRKK
ncbi:hypothetical protein VNO78_03009 [Psophocarpus tetragonolobus]|uniref:FBD domain-containing protein n=1 Tax=Psophocarpus tetragonolobus TaxID=3891 RepID=A0AAN9T0D5_PSOTE